MVGALIYLPLSLICHMIPHCYTIPIILKYTHCPCVGEILNKILEASGHGIVLVQTCLGESRDLDPQCGDIMEISA